MKQILRLAIIALLVSCGTTKQAFTVEDVKRIEAGDFLVTVNTAHPMRGGMVPLSSDYSVRLHGDSIYSYLPYFGEVRNVPYGGGKGLRFDAPFKTYRQSTTAKGTLEVLVETKNDEDSYRYYISLSPSGMASVRVHCNNRDDISFEGNWE